MTDDDIRALWRSVGGSFHGPRIETGTMPEVQLLPFLRELMTAPAQHEGFVVMKTMLEVFDTMNDPAKFRSALATAVAKRTPSNAKVRGDAPLYGAASLSTDGLGGTMKQQRIR